MKIFIGLKNLRAELPGLTILDFFLWIRRFFSFRFEVILKKKEGVLFSHFHKSELHTAMTFIIYNRLRIPNIPKFKLKYQQFKKVIITHQEKLLDSDWLRDWIFYVIWGQILQISNSGQITRFQGQNLQFILNTNTKKN